MRKPLSVILILFIAASFYVYFAFFRTPDFESKEWSEMTITYWTRVSETKKRARQIQLNDPQVMKTLFDLLHPERTQRYRIPVGDQIWITTADGTVWKSCFVFEDRIDFGLAADSQVAYNVFTFDYKFYDKIKEYCLRDLQASYPLATLDHVILRGNTGLSRHPVLITNKQNKSEMATPRKPSD